MMRRGIAVSMVSVALAILFAGTAWSEAIQKKSISLEDAKKAAAAAAEVARKNNRNVVIAIVDEGGHLVYLERFDETQFASIDIAIGKARTAVAYRRPTKALEDALNSGQLAYLTNPGILPREGGIPILLDGKVIGGIGVSGSKPSEDAQMATAGVEALKK